MINPNIPASRIKEITEKSKHFSGMTSRDYARELKELIEQAGICLSNAESTAVLAEAFGLLKTKLGVTIESKFVITTSEGDPT